MVSFDSKTSLEGNGIERQFGELAGATCTDSWESVSNCLKVSCGWF